MNVVLLAIDSLRADHLGCYGYHKNTSPNIDALAAESVVFDRAFATGIPTMPSFTTMLSGLHPYRHGITAHSSEQRLNDEVVLLPQFAQQAGLTTIGIDNLVVQSSGRGAWFARGFDFYSGFLYKPFSDQSEQLVDRAISYIDDYKDKPFLLYLHLWDPHSPYGPPPPYDTMHYKPQRTPRADEPTLAEVKALAPEYYEAFLEDMHLKVPDDYAYVVAQYDGEISYCDAQVGHLIQHLKNAGVWDDTIFIFTSDHGECFGEGGLYFDHHGLYDAVLRLAQMWHVPGNAPGRRDDLVTMEDLLPTVLELCGWSPPNYPLTGRSNAPALGGREQAEHEFMVAVESSRQASLCYRTDRWKLIYPIIRDIHGAPLTGFYGQERSPELQLFDLQNDPAERHDVAPQNIAVRDDLLLRLQQWRDAEVALRGGDDPLLENGLSLDYNDFMARLTARKLRG
jgi:arylsulfatase A-like enzyme